MMTVPSKLTTKYHEPGRNKPCVCGSGMKFKKCCAGTYSSKASDLFKEAFNKGDYEAALTYARNHFTWYALSHKAHTVSFLQSNKEAAKELLAIDIKALGAILDNLHLCYFRLGRSDEFPDVIESINMAIDDERWNAKIAYNLALWHLVDKEDADASFAAIQWINFQLCQDPDLLALYLQVCPTPLSHTDSIAIIDRILVNVQIESHRLQYSILKSIQYYLICQHTDGQRIIEEAIQRFRGLSDDKKSSYGRLQFAHALALNGRYFDKHELLEEAEETFRKLLAEAEQDGYSPLYRANLYKMLGDCEEVQGKHIDAMRSYSASLESNPSELSKVFLVRAICHSGDVEKSRDLLRSINSDCFNEAGKFDLAFSWAIVAVNSLSSQDLDEAKSRLKTVEAHDPIFVQQRDRWMIELLESKPKSNPGKIRKLIRTINRYVTLNPNFFGIGFNLNHLIEDAESTASKNSR